VRLIPSLLALSLLSAPSFAQRWFDIEVVIFERNGQSSSETWPHDTPNIDTSGGINTQMAALVPSFRRCPTLSQQQIQQVIASNQQSELAVGQATKCVLAPNLNITPINSEISEQTALHTAASNGEANQYSSLLKPLTLPTRFNYQGRNYQVVAPPVMPASVPVRVSASSLARSGSPRLLPKSSLRLNWLVKRLKSQKNLNPKLHIGWRQAVKPRHLAQPLHLFAGQNFANRFNQDGSAIGPLLDTGLPQSSQQPWPLWEIDGLFNVYLSHYLFIEIELNRKIASNITLKIPNPVAQDSSSQQPQGVVKPQDDSTSLVSSAESSPLLADPTQLESQLPWLINHPMVQHRRVKSKEIHYFDHPDMGIVVQIRRAY